MVQATQGINTAVLYRMKADPNIFPDGTNLTLSHYGYGYNGTVPGLSTFIKKYISGTWQWQLFGTSADTNLTPINKAVLRTNFNIDSTTRDSDNYIDMLVTIPTQGVSLTAVTSQYVSLTNVAPSGIHVGGMLDIYITDSTNILVVDQTVSNTNGRINLNSINGFVLPLLDVTSVTVQATGQVLTPGSDWQVVTDNIGNTYSTRENPLLLVSPLYNNLNLIVEYRYYLNGAAIQAMFDSQQYRFIGTDCLAKIMPPVYVVVNTMEYQGTATVAEIRAAIEAYINTQPPVLSLTEIISIVLSQKVTNLTLATLDIEINEYDETRSFVTTTPLLTTYTLPTQREFICGDNELQGIVQQ